MTTDEMIRYLQGRYGDIGEITTHIPTAEERSNAMDEGMKPSYSIDPALRQIIEGGPGLSNIRPASFSEQTATPTSYRADLTTPDKEGFYFTGDFGPSGKMVGAPKREKYEPDWFRKNQNLMLAIPGLAAGGAGLLAGGFGGAGGVTAASLGELGLNTALAAGTPGGIASGLSAASLGELGINTALAAGSEGGIAAGTALSGVEAAPSFLDSINLGKTFFPDAPGYVQQGVNRFGTGLVTSGGDPEAAARNALMGGVTDFINPYFSELPKEFQPIAKAGVQSALQGGSAEDIFKGAAGAAILNPISSAVSEVAGPAAAKAATAVTRQLLSSGSIDPSKITVNMLGDFIGSAVSKETNRFLGDAAAAAIRNRGDLEAAFKQLAMGALNTPAKKGG